MMRVLYKTQNGWLITNETGYINIEAIKTCHTFETMRSLTAHLLQLAGEAQSKRDAKGYFCSTKKK